MISGARANLDPLHLRICHRFFGFGLAQLGDQLRIVDNEQGSTRRNVFAPRHGDLCRTTGDAHGDVNAGAFGFGLDQQRSGRARYQIANPIMAKKTPPAIVARGLSSGLRRAVAALGSVFARSSVEGGAMVGGASVIVSQRL
jgi:hypothetical protein